MRTLVLAPTAAAAEAWANRNSVHSWLPLDAPFRLRGFSHDTARVIVLDGGGHRYDRDTLLQEARSRGIPVIHARSAA